MDLAHCLMQESVWFDRHRYEAAEQAEQARLAGAVATVAVATSSLVGEIERARLQIKDSLKGVDAAAAAPPADVAKSIASLQEDVRKLFAMVDKVNARCDALEKTGVKVTAAAPEVKVKSEPEPKADEEEDEAVDLFGGDSEEEEDEEAARVREERVAAYSAKKQKKPALVAKSMIVLDVKPWEDETDLVEMERLVRGVEADGLVWGASKLVPLAYGIRKLQISCVVEDDKVGTDFLEEAITAFDDHVQSVDIAAFNKL